MNLRIQADQNGWLGSAPCCGSAILSYYKQVGSELLCKALCHPVNALVTLGVNSQAIVKLVADKEQGGICRTREREPGEWRHGSDRTIRVFNRYCASRVKSPAKIRICLDQLLQFGKVESPRGFLPLLVACSDALQK